MVASGIIFTFWVVFGALSPAQAAMDLVTEGLRSLERRDLEAARERFERALLQAREEKSARAEAGARWGLGEVHLGKAQYPAAREQLEQARARAFLDLLTTRELAPRGSDRSQLAGLREMEKKLREAGIDSAGKTGSTTVPLTVRGADSDALALWQKWQTVDSELKSLVSARPFSAAEVSAAAARLRSTVLAYWVSPESTFIWVAVPGRPVRSARVSAGAEHLRKLIANTLPAQGSAPAIIGRGGDTIHMDESAKRAWRELYGVLVRPVRQWLPGAAGSRLTVIPHGPLLRASFAALLDDQDRYLVARSALHYVPAAAVLEFTERRKRQVAGRPARYLLIADPTALPPSAAGTPLTPLPGSRREVSEIARQAPEGAASILTGDRAREATIRAIAQDKTVIHFATHGVLRDDQPFDSFLALSNEERLTAQKIYGLELTADLVVLSACRTALGKISGDGMLGLARAFFYAGTPSVVATLWDVADDPTFLLVSDFYRQLARFKDKARALRAAQMNLLGALRRGEVKVNTARRHVHSSRGPDILGLVRPPGRTLRGCLTRPQLSRFKLPDSFLSLWQNVDKRRGDTGLGTRLQLPIMDPRESPIEFSWRLSALQGEPLAWLLSRNLSGNSRRRGSRPLSGRSLRPYMRAQYEFRDKTSLRLCTANSVFFPKPPSGRILINGKSLRTRMPFAHPSGCTAGSLPCGLE